MLVRRGYYTMEYEIVHKNANESFIKIRKVKRSSKYIHLAVDRHKDQSGMKAFGWPNV